MRPGIRHKLPLSSARPSFSSPLNIPTVSAADHHRCGMGMGVRIGKTHKLPPNSAGASFSSPVNIPPVSTADPHRCSTRGSILLLDHQILTISYIQSKHQDLAACLQALNNRFSQASQAPQAPPQEAPQLISQSLCHTPKYHHCKLYNASFS